MRWRYTGTRKKLFGKWCYPGDVISNQTKPPGAWVLSKNKEPQVKETIDDEIGQVTESDGIKELRKELLKKKMKDIRVIGKEYDAYDTKKSELVDEIIQAKLKLGEL